MQNSLGNSGISDITATEDAADVFGLGGGEGGVTPPPSLPQTQTPQKNAKKDKNKRIGPRPRKGGKPKPQTSYQFGEGGGVEGGGY